MASPPKDGCRIGSDANDPRKAVPNKNCVCMGIRMDPCKIQVLFPLAPE